MLLIMENFALEDANFNMRNAVSRLVHPGHTFHVDEARHGFQTGGLRCDYVMSPFSTGWCCCCASYIFWSQHFTTNDLHIHQPWTTTSALKNPEHARWRHSVMFPSADNTTTATQNNSVLCVRVSFFWDPLVPPVSERAGAPDQICEQGTRLRLPRCHVSISVLVVPGVCSRGLLATSRPTCRQCVVGGLRPPTLRNLPSWALRCIVITA